HQGEGVVGGLDGADGADPETVPARLRLVDGVVLEDHQLVILGHELWHMQAGHCSHHVEGAVVAARLLSEGADLQATVLKVAARTRSHLADEAEAESFGLLLASKCRTWLAGSPLRRPTPRDGLAGRIEASLGYRGPQS
ncbi:toxin-antitoxin system, toxin component, partial [Streptomyces sp. NPDC057757]|uniref:toxin-antitoxin system, toxin component n=1 Tax=Streptomyces sp. NPDC057757 TaxID=3346241 RepID=UPI0036B8C372